MQLILLALITSWALLVTAGAAHADPVTLALTTAATSFLTTAGVSAATAATIGSMAASAFVQIASGVALSAISRALASKPGEGGLSGMKVSLAFGEDQPGSFILGTHMAAGDLLYHNSWGHDDDMPNEYYVQVIELADLPARLQRVWINGEWAKLKTTAEATGLGFPVEGYERDDHDRLWVKFYDGTQTTADPYLVEKFGADPDRPWLPDMVGIGVPYAIVTAGLRDELHKHRPECKFELVAWGHYDRRKDSTAGGIGAQRADDWQTWQPTSNAVVLIENVLRGIRDPFTDEFMWGGQGIITRDLPASVWFAAMNECDQAIDLAGGGTEPQYRAGLEVRVEDEPAAVIEELLKACQGLIAEIAGEWHVRAGPPGLPVYAFTDDDIVITASDSFDPFPGIDEAYNEVNGAYPEPAEGWEQKDAPARKNATFLAEDLGRRRSADMKFPAVHHRRQVQRLMASALKDQRRFRRHAPLVLPPDARALGPLDEVTWTSDRYGYAGKDWSVDLVEDLRNGCVGLALRERDPTDYDWSAGDELDAPVGYQRRPPRPYQLPNFEVFPAWTESASGVPRAPAIRLSWEVRRNTTAIRYRVRLAADHTHVPLDAQAAQPPGSDVSEGLTLSGEAATLNLEPVTWTLFTDEEAGETLISGRSIYPATDYEVQAIYVPVAGRRWSDWLPVTTPDIRIKEGDLDDEVTTKIDDAKDAADAAAAAANEALDKATEVEDFVNDTLSEEALEDLHELHDALLEFDFDTLNNLTGIAVAGIRGPDWVKDPIFDAWTGSDLTHWTTVGVVTYGSEVAGHYPSALLVTVPGTTSDSVSLTAKFSDGQMPTADLTVEYVAVELMVVALSGNIAGFRCRPEWSAPGESTFTRGHAWGLASPTGGPGDTHWDLEVDADRIQSAVVIWRRPIPVADDVQLHLSIKMSSPTDAVTMRIDYCGMRSATEAEVKAYLANAYTDASIISYDITITGPTGAIAAAVDQLTVDYGAADAVVAGTVVVVANDLGALAGTVETISTRFGGNNHVSNPVFLDGVRPAGEDPNGYTNWGSEFSVIEKGSTAEAPVMSAPTQFMGRLNAVTTFQACTAHEPVPCKPGNHVEAVFSVAAIGAGAFSLTVAARLRWYGSDRTTQITSFSRPLTITVGDVWQTTAFEEVEVPAGVSYYDMQFVRQAGGSAKALLFTQLESRVVDGMSYAKASTAITTSTSAEGAVAGIVDSIEAEFDDVDAFVTETKGAVVTSEKAASAYVLRAQAGGGGEASLGLFSWDDETGVGNAIRMNGQVIAPQSISTGELVITDLGYNMVPDNQIQSENAWQTADGFSVIRDTLHATAGSQGELRWAHSSGGGVVSSLGQDFPVKPGDKLVCSAQVAAFSAGTYLAGCSLRYLNKDRSFHSLGAIDSVEFTGFGLQELEATKIVPSGAFLARWRFWVDKDVTAVDVRFFAPSVIRNSAASVLITPDGAFFSQLQAEDAWIENAMIGNAEVDTLKVAGSSITVSTFHATTQTGDTLAYQFSVNMAYPGSVIWIIQVEQGGNVDDWEEGDFTFAAFASMTDFPGDGETNLGINAHGTGVSSLGVHVFPARFSTGSRDGPCRLRLEGTNEDINSPRFEVRVVALRTYR